MPPRSRATWNSSCDAILVETLLKERSDGMQTSNGNWHTDAWGAAERALAGTELQSGGIPKTGVSCQNRWAAVSPILAFKYRSHAESSS
jgi:hypothetical protein